MIGCMSWSECAPILGPHVLKGVTRHKRAKCVPSEVCQARKTSLRASISVQFITFASDRINNAQIKRIKANGNSVKSTEMMIVSSVVDCNDE